MTVELNAEFQALPRPTALRGKAERFNATVQVDGPYLLGKDRAGRPVQLIAVAADSSGRVPPPMLLENLSVQHRISCSVEPTGKKPYDGKFTLIRCLSDDPAVQRYFLRVVGFLGADLGLDPTYRAVDEAVSRMVALFEAIRRAPRKLTLGLWAELFLIANARHAAPLVRAWHATPGDLIDFNAGNQRIEVKGTAQPHREHRFRLEQLYLPAGASGIIASMFVESAGAGISVRDLVEQVRATGSMSADDIWRIEAIVGETLGNAYSEASELTFDAQVARESLRFVDVDVVPRIAPDSVPSTVRDVHFIADLTGCTTLSLSQLRQMGGLFDSL